VFRAPGFLRGHVVDFLQLPHWPIFNVADMCINVAAAVILVQALRGMSLDGTRTRKEPAP
jgi:signal peptidase II